LTELPNLRPGRALQRVKYSTKELRMSKRLLTVTGLAACLAVPATALAGEPTGTDKSNASRECRAERGTTDATREAFAQTYGTARSNYKNAFGKCVSSRAKDEQAERLAAKRGAARDCREERADLGIDAFRERYGTERSNRRNAFGKCVSQHAKKRLKAADRADRQQIEETHNAAQECADEREAMGDDAFEQKWGTERSKRNNAFGKCVSNNARS
jgi:hypothetical protein